MTSPNRSSEHDVEALGALARKIDGESSQRDDLASRQVWLDHIARDDANTSRTNQRTWIALASAALVIGAIGAITYSRVDAPRTQPADEIARGEPSTTRGQPTDHHLTSTIESSHQAPTLEPAPMPATLDFTDGSRVVLSPGARAYLAKRSERGATFDLERGEIELYINPESNGQWFVNAGNLSVRVTGTVFTVNQNEASTTVSVERGSVAVSRLDSATHLVDVTAGRRLVYQSAGTWRLEPTRTVALAAPRQPEEDTSSIAAPTTRREAPPVSAKREPSSSAPSSHKPLSERAAPTPSPIHLTWPEQVANGGFSQVVDEARSIGIDHACGTIPAASLAALADAARYAREPEIARSALLAKRARFADTASAREAAFLLGKLEEQQRDHAAALRWYETYQREAHDGPLIDKAAGRRMILLERLDKGDEASAAARDYLEQFASTGAYVSLAKKILARQ